MDLNRLKKSIPDTKWMTIDTQLVLRLIAAVESSKDKIDKLENLYDQVDAMLSMAKRKYQTVVDDGDYWEISDDTFQEVQKAFDEIKTALPKEP